METLRQRLTHLLTSQTLNAKDLSRELGIREKEVYAHLHHVEKSVQGSNRRFEILPSRCLGCDYVFSERKRYTRPGRCPRCKSGRITNPAYRIR